MEPKPDQLTPKPEMVAPKNPDRALYEEKVSDIQRRLRELDQEIWELERKDREERAQQETERRFAQLRKQEVQNPTTKIETAVGQATAELEKRNQEIIATKLEEVSKNTTEEATRSQLGELLSRLRKKATNSWRARILTGTMLASSVLGSAALSYKTPMEWWLGFQNYLERNVEHKEINDPEIKGIDAVYNSTTSVEKSTYDFLGKEKLDYKWGYYMTSVFDLTDKTPPRFKIIERGTRGTIENAAGITTNLYSPFFRWDELKANIQPDHNLSKEQYERGEIPVVAYNTKDQTIRAGNHRDFNNDWMVSGTWRIPLNFTTNADGTMDLVYAPGIYRMAPKALVKPDGNVGVFTIGITADQNVKKINPHEATRFGMLDGGKVLLVCGSKQLQVNGSFADIYKVYERLKKEYPTEEIIMYGLDNGAYNLPMWTKGENGTITGDMIIEHTSRHYNGGTALVLMNDQRISPYEYKDRYLEYKHIARGNAVNPESQKPEKNNRTGFVINYTGNVGDIQDIIREYKDSDKGKSFHVLITKDGTRHVFNEDDSVLAHSGDKNFSDQTSIDFSSLGISLEGDTADGQQFSLAQVESLLEYMRPRIEKYGIPLEKISSSLDERVWTQIREVVAKKLYNIEKVKPDSVEASQMLGILAYQEAYRLTKNEDYALTKATEVLKEGGVSGATLDKALAWIKDKAIVDKSNS